MKICFPVTGDLGIESAVFNHFGSASMFLIVDSETGEIDQRIERDPAHAHGRCQPLKALAGSAVDAIVVGGIGKGALSGLNQAGLKVYRALSERISGNLDLLKKNRSLELTPEMVCGGHAGAHGHDHGHGTPHDCSCV